MYKCVFGERFPCQLIWFSSYLLRFYFGKRYYYQPGIIITGWTNQLCYWEKILDDLCIEMREFGDIEVCSASTVDGDSGHDVGSARPQYSYLQPHSSAITLGWQFVNTASSGWRAGCQPACLPTSRCWNTPTICLFLSRVLLDYQPAASCSYSAGSLQHLTLNVYTCLCARDVITHWGLTHKAAFAGLRPQ